MKSSPYRQMWQDLLRRGPTEQALIQLARQTAFSFIDHCYYGDHYEPEHIDLLCDMATQTDHPSWRAAANEALFGVVIEGLCDDYEDFQFETYGRVMTQLITACRRMPPGKRLDERLNEFGLRRDSDLLQRARIVHEPSPRFDPSQSVDQIFVLSRITIGADVAIVSVMVQRLLSLFPGTGLCILGSPKLRDIFAGNRGVRIRAIEYARRGGIFERFEAWHQVLDILDAEVRGPLQNRTLILDPDSRVTQLGVLPLSDTGRHLVFDSHQSSSGAQGSSMGELTNAWMDRVFGPAEFTLPKVWPEEDGIQSARALAQGLRQRGCARIVSVNFGVGGNARKRLGDGFERKLILQLLKCPGTVVLLDMGLGSAEMESSRGLLRASAGEGHPALQIRFDAPEEAPLSHGILGLECGIGQMAAVIGQSDEFIGYDSACQHMAAALEIPTLTIFAGTNTPRFIRRWSACGKLKPKIVHVNTLMNGLPTDIDGAVDRVMQERLSDDLPAHG